MEVQGAEHLASPRGGFLAPGKGRFGQKGCTHALHLLQDQVHGWTRACSTRAAGEGRGRFLLRKSHPDPPNSSPSPPGLLSPVTEPCPTGGTGARLHSSQL